MAGLRVQAVTVRETYTYSVELLPKPEWLPIDVDSSLPQEESPDIIGCCGCPGSKYQFRLFPVAGGLKMSWRE